MLQFCSHGGEEELRVTLLFHYGGKPLVMETAGNGFTGELIMATLDHKLLGGLGRRPAPAARGGE